MAAANTITTASILASPPQGTFRRNSRIRNVNLRNNRRVLVKTSAKDISFDQRSRTAHQIGADKLADAVGITLGPRGICSRFSETNTAKANGFFKVGHKSLIDIRNATVKTYASVSQELSNKSSYERYGRQHHQNVDLPQIQPKNKKKPYAIPLKKMQRAARADKKLAEMGIEKPLEPPKNGLLVPELIPIAYDTLEAWKELIKGLSQLLTVVPVHGCRNCPEIHVGKVPHRIQDCRGRGNTTRRSHHLWVAGSITDVLIPIESYHLFDPFGRRVKHETRFNYDRIPALLELCIQAGVDLPEYPSRRRTNPIRVLGKKIIDRGGFAEEPSIPDPSAIEPVISQYDPAAARWPPPPAPTDMRRLAERTVKAYSRVRSGGRQLMRKYPVKACGYCTEVHVGPWGHNAKLCGAFKHQWRDGKHGWQDATLDEVVPPNYVWHVRDAEGPPLGGALKRFYGKAPAVVEVCVQAGAEVPDAYRPMMRLDVVVPDSEEARMAA